MAMLKRQLKRLIVLTLATVFLLLGLAGLVLPVLQGWLFLMISALLFSLYSPSLREFIHRHASKYPRIHPYIHKAQDWTTRVFGAPEV